MLDSTGKAYEEWPQESICTREFGSQGEAALDETELLRAVVDATFEAIVIHRDGKVLAANHRFATMHGYEPEEVIGRCVYDFVANQSRDRVIERVAEDARELFCGVGQRKDGSTFFVEVRGHTINFNGRPARASSIMDISARRDAEEALRETRDELRQTQKMLAVGRLAAGIAHDFNNLLTIINGYNHLIMRRKDVADDVAEAARAIQRTSRRAAALTQQLLTFSRRQVPIQRILDLNQVVYEADRLLERVLGEHIHLEINLGEKLHPIRADHGQLDQVILNLAINARDAMPEGGRLTISTENWEVCECGAAHTGLAIGTPGVRMSISDTGIGMNEETRRRLFEPFFTTKPRGEGTGLGLASAQDIISQNGGFIAVESGEGTGTTFRIFFPAAAGEVPTPEPDDFVPSGEAVTGTILLVEDNDEIRLILRNALIEAGFAVMEARSGREANRILKAEYVPPLDLLITDVIMPGLGGMELADGLLERYPNLKILFMTGYPNEDIQHVLADDRGIEVLQKPFTPEALVSRARALLRRLVQK
ncbi:response regulator [bacterium]|nr:response regulator [bacterium]